MLNSYSSVLLYNFMKAWFFFLEKSNSWQNCGSDFTVLCATATMSRLQKSLHYFGEEKKKKSPRNRQPIWQLHNTVWKMDSMLLSHTWSAPSPEEWRLTSSWQPGIAWQVNQVNLDTAPCWWYPHTHMPITYLDNTCKWFSNAHCKWINVIIISIAIK